MIDEENSSRRSTPVPSFIIDPFSIGPDHVEHYTSARIIKIESLGKVFCPTCLARASDDVLRIEDESYDSYISGLFMILDEHFEKEQVRKIIIRTLHIFMVKRTPRVKTDSEFHNLLRLIYLVMKSDTFTWQELSPLSRIFAKITTKFIETNPIPLKSVWKIIKCIFNLVRMRLNDIDTKNTVDEDSAEFLSCVPISISAYLSVLGRFTFGQISDLIFPLYLNDTAETHNQQYYRDSQQECLRVTRCLIVPKCWDIMAVARHANDHELNLLCELFNCLSHCLVSAVRIKDEKFLMFLKNSDFLAISHSLIFRYGKSSLEKPVKNLVREYVLHFVEDYLGSDAHIELMKRLDDIVETNHRRALDASKDETERRRTVFYFLANYVAKTQDSKYFKIARVRKLVQSTQPIKLDILDSIVIMRAHSSLLPAVLIDSLGIESEEENKLILQSIKEVWRLLRKENKFELFREIYCFDSEVFLWAYKLSGFRRLFNVDCLEFILRNCLQQDKTVEVFECLLAELYYQEQLQLYLTESDEFIAMLKKLVEITPCGSQHSSGHKINQHVSIIRSLSTLMSSLFYRSLLEYINGQYEKSYLERVIRVVNSINYLMTVCEHFDFEVPDERFIDDLFIALERLYKEPVEVDSTLIIPFNELLTLLISHRHQYMMKVLLKLEFGVLGLMYERIADYTKGDHLAESIARLLVTYDEIDYPVRYSIENSLIMMTHSTFNWMLSENAELHLLAMKLAHRALRTESSHSRRACIATGFLHMLITNPHIMDNQLELVRSIMCVDEIIYNPLIPKVMPILTAETRRELEEHLGLVSERCVSPALSFSSSTDSNILEDPDVVSDIISKLYEAEPHRDQTSSRVPNFLYVSQCIDDNESAPMDMDSWAQRAYETTQDNTVRN